MEPQFKRESYPISGSILPQSWIDTLGGNAQSTLARDRNWERFWMEALENDQIEKAIPLSDSRLFRSSPGGNRVHGRIQSGGAVWNGAESSLDGILEGTS